MKTRVEKGSIGELQALTLNKHVLSQLRLKVNLVLYYIYIKFNFANFNNIQLNKTDISIENSRGIIRRRILLQIMLMLSRLLEFGNK